MTRRVISLFILLFALAFHAPASATIASVQNQTVVFGNGATTVFSANFVPDTSSNIEVIYTNTSGVSTTLPPSQYRITIPPVPTGQLWPQGFSVTYPLSGSPIPNGASLTIQRILPLQQLTSISQQGNFYPKVVEQALDKGVMQAQQISARTGRLRGTWLQDTEYNIGDVVQDGAAGLDSGNYYTCAIANTSGVWSTDLSNGYWSLSLPAVIPSAPLPLSIANGGTGATSAGTALNNLGGIALSGDNAFTGDNTHAGTEDFTSGVINVATQSSGDSTTRAASTQFVTNNGKVNSGTANQLAYYGTSGVAISGTNAVPNGTTATTQSSGDNSTKIATTAYVNSTFQMGTAKSTSSGTSVDFTSLPSGLKRVTIYLDGVQTNGTSQVIIQLGSSSGPATSGYVGSASTDLNGATPVVSNLSTGLMIGADGSASYSRYAVITCALSGSNVWICGGTVGHGDSLRIGQVTGRVPVGGTLDRVRLTTANGTDAFVAGAYNIIYEN